jgi:hypothetical protein
MQNLPTLPESASAENSPTSAPNLSPWPAAQLQRWQNRVRELPGHLKISHAEVGRPSARLADRRRPHPNQCRPRHSSVAGDAPGRTSGDVPIVPQKGGSCPSTAPPSGRRAASILPCSDWNSQSAELVPTLQTSECADWDFALARPELRRPPADMLVT